MVDFSTAVNAYQQAAGSVSNAAKGAKIAPMAAGDEESFASLVTDSLKSAVQSGRRAEELSLKEISGEADLKDVVTAVANAEHTLETVVAVRDKVLSAYQEILRMPI
ncbi:MAG: flagellar hook-basal body complex protein FliE [Rhodospirillaceae bacterium]|nr:flagellar hook-basal body complex protein FliE [Rhodospirillaceae bacterium]